MYLINSSTKKVDFDNFDTIIQTASVLETMDYYPFGLAWHVPGSGAASRTENKFWHTSKEMQSNEWGAGSGIDLEDFGARMYDPAVGRWWGVDPLAHKYSSMSPYVFCGNMLPNAYDPDGQKIKILYYDADGHKRRVIIREGDTFDDTKARSGYNYYVIAVLLSINYLLSADIASGNNIIDQLINSRKTLTIRMPKFDTTTGEFEEDGYNYRSNTIVWHPFSGVNATDLNGRMIDPATDQPYGYSVPANNQVSRNHSPALDLYGEMTHSYRDFFMHSQFKKGVRTEMDEPKTGWNNMDEYNANEMESNVARLLSNEAVRYKHADDERDWDVPYQGYLNGEN